MPDPDPIPQEVRRLLADRIDSIAQLEILLLLHRTAPEGWETERISSELRLQPAWVDEHLRTLREREFLVRAGPSAHRYHPASPELAKAVSSLAATYADRRVTVVSLIYSKPIDPVRVFAEAFRIRKEEPDG
jgi:hypothetical protein